MKAVWKYFLSRQDTSTAKYKGSVDDYFGRHLSGWSFVDGEPKEKSWVVLCLNGHDIAVARADRFRADLVEAGYGDGDCAFEFELPDGLSGSEIVQVRVANTSIIIPNSNHPLDYYRSDTAPFSAHAAAAIDGIFCGVMWGWAQLDGMAQDQLQLTLYLDDHEIARATANQDRADLVKGRVGGNRCGFEFVLPNNLTGKEVVQVRVGNSFTAIGNGGRPLEEYRTLSNPFRILDHGLIDGVFDRLMWGWVHLDGEVQVLPQLALLLDGQEIVRTTADQYRPDLEKAGYANGRCGFEFVLPESLSGMEVVHVRLVNSVAVVRNSGRTLNEYRTHSPRFSLRNQGVIDQALGAKLGGWAFGENGSVDKPKLILYLDGNEVGRTTADRYRPDMAQAGYGDGKCGFEFKLPDDLSGNEIVQVQIAESQTTIDGSGRALREISIIGHAS